MEILRAAQGGRFVANAGVAAGVDETAAAAVLSRMGPAIAAQLRKRAEDPQAFEALLDLLEDGDGDAFLDDSNFMDDPELIKDGKAVLTDIFGSAKAARSALAIEARDDAMMKLAAIAASAVLAVLARQYARPQMQGLMGAQRASSNGSEQGGILSTIVEAVIKGVVQETTRQLAPKKRRRRTTSVFGTRTRRRTRKRRNTTPSLDQIFGEIIGAIRR
ncbi:DUF937 domain-containing protein [Nordella sp. HKS 07]|uniref:DUF937 domain-containing protein n=1 Tax=Nordella sp. HKS 07 TaxID=2712222 RepID=UPI0013E111B3|nr:DUF937 domain-containing protein [Nordella sp. HKS 07]QIG49156.1 DUF937 domain-containing protein [Nordella sp. HKS 07]